MKYLLSLLLVFGFISLLAEEMNPKDISGSGKADCMTSDCAKVTVEYQYQFAVSDYRTAETKTRFKTAEEVNQFWSECFSEAVKCEVMANTLGELRRNPDKFCKLVRMSVNDSRYLKDDINLTQFTITNMNVTENKMAELNRLQLEHVITAQVEKGSWTFSNRAAFWCSLASLLCFAVGGVFLLKSR